VPTAWDFVWEGNIYLVSNWSVLFAAAGLMVFGAARSVVRRYGYGSGSVGGGTAVVSPARVAGSNKTAADKCRT